MLSTLLTHSCEKSEAEITVINNNINLSKLENFQSKNKDEQKIIYRLLNKNEKHRLWNDRFKYILENENLNNEQKEALLELKTIASVDYFNTEFTKKKVITLEAVKGWVIEYENKFNRDDFILYFGSQQKLVKSTSRDGTTIDDADPEIDDCECHDLEDYCIGSSFECKKSKCDKKYGCGFLWGEECNGGCEQKPY